MLVPLLCVPRRLTPRLPRHRLLALAPLRVSLGRQSRSRRVLVLSDVDNARAFAKLVLDPHAAVPVPPDVPLTTGTHLEAPKPGELKALTVVAMKLSIFQQVQGALTASEGATFDSKAAGGVWSPLNKRLLRIRAQSLPAGLRTPSAALSLSIYLFALSLPPPLPQ